MKNELQLLIEELQNEHDLLENEVNLCIEGRDFIGAEAFNKSLVHTKQNLSILKNLENPNFDKIRSLKNSIKYYDGLKITDEFPSYFVERAKAKIPALEKELEQLEKRKIEDRNDNDKIIECLEQLVSGVLSYFEIHFADKKLKIRFEKLHDSLNIYLQATHLSNFYKNILDIKHAELKQIGFVLEESGARLEIESFGQHKILDIMETLSRIIYDVFRLYGTKQAEIRY